MYDDTLLYELLLASVSIECVCILGIKPTLYIVSTHPPEFELLISVVL